MLTQRVKRKIKQFTAGILSAAMMLTILPVQVIGDDEYIETGVAETTTVAETEIVTEPTVTEVSETEIPVTEMYENIVVPINLTRTAIDESSVTVAWDLTDTASYYEVYCNSNVFASNIVNTSYKLTGLNGGTEYFITVNAYNDDGILVGTSNEICVHTSWIIKSDTTLDRDIIVENLYLNSGTLNVNGHTITVNNDLGIGSGTLYVNGGSIYVANNFNQRWTNGDVSWGYLQMTNPNDYICVNGDYYCYAGYGHNGKLTNGVLEVKGNFTQKKYSYADNFYSTNNHRVILSGETKQTVSFENMESRVNVLDIMNFSIDGVVFTTSINAGEIKRNGCNVTFSNGEISGWTLTEDEIYNGDLNLSVGTLDLNGYKLTITGNLIHSGGTISVNNGELEVQGDYLVQSMNNGVYGASAGTLNMTNEADTVKVLGDFVMQSTASHSGKLTAGTLEIGGNFTQKGGSSYNFCASGTHTVILNGSEAQTISIADYNKDYSRFNNLKITNSSETGVNFATDAYVVGNLYNTESVLTNSYRIILSGNFADNAWNHDIWLNENRTLNSDLEIGGTLYLNYGTLDLNGYTLTVNKDLYVSANGSTTYLNVNKGKLYVNGNLNLHKRNGSYSYGYLTMENADDYVCVNGNFTVYSYYAYSTYTAGTIEIKGNLVQKRYSQSNNFCTSKNLTVILSGDSKQLVNFASVDSSIQTLEIRNYSEEGVVFETNVTTGTIIDNGCNITFPNGERAGWTLEGDETIEGDLYLARGTLDLNGYKLTVTGNLIHSSGTILVNGGTLEVQGDYRVQTANGENYTASTGVLNMTNEADTVKVLGSFVMQSNVSHSGKLTAGTLEVGGDLIQLYANYYNFDTSGTHTIILNGTEMQTVDIDSYSSSKINNLKITNTSSEGVTIDSVIYLAGTLYNTETPVAKGANIYMLSTAVFADNTWNHNIRFVENRTLENDLHIGGLVSFDGGTFDLNGHTMTVGSYVNLWGTTLKINGGQLLVDGDFNFGTTSSYSRGYLQMTNENDYVLVGGNFYDRAYYSQSGKITAGVLEVKGNFTQVSYSSEYNFYPTGTHKTILSGDVKQTVSFANLISRFNIVEIKNISEEGVFFSTPVTIGTIIDNGCNVTFANGERAGWTLEDDETFEGDLYLSRGTLDLNGNKLTVTGNLIHSGGTILVNNGTLEVQGDYRVQAKNGTNYTTGTGVLNMTNEADTVKVFGDFVMQSTASHSGKLTAGTLEIEGNFTQIGGSAQNFCTSGTHTVILNGSEAQTVSISNNSKDYSRFNNLKITNSSETGVNFATDVYVIGNLYNTESVLTNSNRIILAGNFADNVWNHDIWLNENRTLNADTEIGGTLYLNYGTLDLNGYTLTVNKDLYVSANGSYTYLNVNKGKLYVNGNLNLHRRNGSYSDGYLTMKNAEDYVCVNGNLTVYSYYARSTYTAGAIEIKGNLIQKCYGYSNNFCTGKNLTVILSGDSKQLVNFASVDSSIQTLEIRNYSEEGVVFETNVTTGTIIDNGCNITFPNGERAGWTLEGDETIEGDLYIGRGVLDLNGYKLTVTGKLVHSGGTINVNKGVLEVQGDYRVQTKSGTSYIESTGVLNMANETDTVKVLGDFVMQSTASHSGKLTAGTLEVGGNLTQIGGSAQNFCTSGTHTVILNGSEAQTVNISNNSKDYSRFNNLKITNSSETGVNFATDVYVIGNLYNTESVLTNSSRIILTGNFADNAWDHDIWLNENRTLNSDIEIGGTLYLNGGTLDLNGYTLNVDGNVYISAYSNTTYLKLNKGKMYVNGNLNLHDKNGNYSYGYLTMTNAEDYICVNGNFTVYSYYSESTYTAGTIEIKGNFVQKYYRNGNNFAPSGNHKVILSGIAVQNVSFASTQSQFNILEITKPLNTGYVFSRNPLWKDIIPGVRDTEPPTAPENLEFVRSTSSSIMLTWDKSEDNKTVIGYNIYRDEELVGKTSELQYIDNGLSSHSAYVYYVTACDIDDNESKPSNIIEAETDVDEFAPTQPANLSAAVRSETTVNLAWTGSSDNGTVVKYNIYRNDILIGSSNGTSYTDNTAFSGFYEYCVEAVDNDDNTSKKSAKVSIDNAVPSAPELTISSVNDLYIKLEWTGYDNVGVVRYEVYKNNIKTKTVDVTTYIDSAIVIDSNYEYYVVAYDAYGNASEKSNIATVYTGEDDEAPTITGIQPVSELNSGNAVIRISAKDNRGLDKIFIEVSSNNIDWTVAGMVSASKGTSETVNCAVDTTEYSDGKLYIRAYAEDIKGNVGLASESPICEITVDNTAPVVPSGLTVNLMNSQIEIVWDEHEDEDTACFRIYRKTDSDSEFTVIKDNYKYLNYFDTDIELGVNYTYCVSAVDNMGNESAMTSEVSGSIADDKVIPEIISIYPKNGAVLETSQIVGISVKDNFRLNSLNVECRPANGEWHTVFSEENINNYAKTVQFELDTSSFTTGSYELRAYAYDTAGNISEYAVGTYTFKECVLSAPVLSAEGEGWRNELSWTMENTEDLLGYHIYRKTLKNSEFSLIASIKGNEYTDSNVTPGKVYYYYVEAVDSRNNYVKSGEVTSVPTSEDDILPLADAGRDVLGIAGEAVNFSGVNSWDNHYISSYTWDFGDGTSSASAIASHIYENEGTYDVTLTVTDSAGNSDSHTIKAYIYNGNYGTVQFKTTNEANNAPLGGVKIYCEIPGVDSTDFVTDSNGYFKFIAPKGTYDVYFYKNEYLPEYMQITVTGESIVQKISLEKKELVEGKLTVKTLDINEIVALGIDITAPENQFVYEYNIEYDKNGKLTFTLNAMGDIIGEVNGTLQTERDGVFTTVSTLKGEKGRPVRAEYGSYEEGEGIPVSVAVFNVTTQLSWLKEFYDVELTIINNADDDFYIQNSQAVLTLPDGLSLADTDRKESLVQVMGNKGVIGGTETKSASWIVRGDKPGSYDLSAEFTGMLMPLCEEVKVIFNTEEPLVVHDGTGLKLDITVTEGLDYWTNQFTFTNNSDRPIYNFAASFSGTAELAEVTDMIIKYPSGSTEIVKWNEGVPDIENAEMYISVLATDYESVYDLRTINPGETVTGYFSILRQDGFTNDY